MPPRVPGTRLRVGNLSVNFEFSKVFSQSKNKKNVKPTYRFPGSFGHKRVVRRNFDTTSGPHPEKRQSISALRSRHVRMVPRIKQYYLYQNIFAVGLFSYILLRRIYIIIIVIIIHTGAHVRPQTSDLIILLLLFRRQ